MSRLRTNKLLSSTDRKEHATWEELESLLLSRIEDIETAVSTKTIQQITDEVLKAENS